MMNIETLERFVRNLLGIDQTVSPCLWHQGEGRLGSNPSPYAIRSSLK